MYEIRRVIQHVIRRHSRLLVFLHSRLTQQLRVRARIRSGKMHRTCIYQMRDICSFDVNSLSPTKAPSSQTFNPTSLAPVSLSPVTADPATSCPSSNPTR
ncbi:hypothetical protein AAMO2058_001011200 [Amorphochlora amoebiformis]